MKYAPLLLLLLLPACSLFRPEAPTSAGAVYSKTNYASLPGWEQDNLAEALPAFAASCQRLAAVPPDRSLGADGHMGKAGDWQSFCTALPLATDTASLRSLIEAQLQPWAVSEGNNPEGLFTGYYESELQGSLTQHDGYQTPLYQRPADLIMIDLGEFRDELKGQRIAGRNVNGQLKPYEDRAAIVGGKINATPLVWLNDPVDAFFVQVQGSGRVMLDNGSELRVGYDGQNGHIYTAIGRELIRRGELTSETVSMQSIRDWLESHPTEADTLMNTNRSYVFFRAANAVAGPTGAANVPLTPQRSLAVDNRYIGYHVPVWLVASSSEAAGPLRRLLIAQDTGGAIKGIVRGDVFWGHGPQAEAAAGAMKARGRYFVLLPTGLIP